MQVAQGRFDRSESSILKPLLHFPPLECKAVLNQSETFGVCVCGLQTNKNKLGIKQKRKHKSQQPRTENTHHDDDDVY